MTVASSQTICKYAHDKNYETQSFVHFSEVKVISKEFIKKLLLFTLGNNVATKLD